MAPPPLDPAVLMIDELIEQFLLRLPPEDPADLARAALVSKQWHRVVTAAVFRRRYIELHRSAPLLGYIDNLGDSIRFVSVSPSFRPRHFARRRDVEAIHACHGRVLLRPIRDRPIRCWKAKDICLFVWDPIMNKEWELPVLRSSIPYWDAAVVCAVGDGCSHLDCHFKVVIVGEFGGNTFSCFYSSEAGSWSDDRIFGTTKRSHIMAVGGLHFDEMESVLVGNTLYFRKTKRLADGVLLKYDLLTQKLRTFSLQCEEGMSFEKERELGTGGGLIATGDGRLGVAMTRNSTLCLCVMEQERLAESRDIQLHGLLPDEALQDKPQVAAFADTGAGGVIFLRTGVGYFTIDLNSGTSKKVGECLGALHIVPYVSFCTPVSGTVSTDEGQGASSVVATDHEPGAGVAVIGDKGPGDVAISSVDEEQEGGGVLRHASYCSLGQLLHPASGTVSTDEGQGASSVVATDYEPGAGVAVTGDKGPGDVAISSVDVEQGPSMSGA